MLQVTGDELERWDVTDGSWRHTASPASARPRSFGSRWKCRRSPMRRSATLTLPVPRIDGLARMQGVFSVVGDAGVTVEEVVTDGAAQPAERASIRRRISSRSTNSHAARRAARDGGKRAAALLRRSRHAGRVQARGDLHRAHAHAAPGKGRRVSSRARAARRRGSAGRARADDTEPDWRIGGREAAHPLERALGGKGADHLQNPHAPRAGELDAARRRRARPSRSATRRSTARKRSPATSRSRPTRASGSKPRPRKRSSAATAARRRCGAITRGSGARDFALEGEGGKAARRSAGRAHRLRAAAGRRARSARADRLPFPPLRRALGAGAACRRRSRRTFISTARRSPSATWPETPGRSFSKRN